MGQCTLVFQTEYTKPFHFDHDFTKMIKFKRKKSTNKVVLVSSMFKLQLDLITTNEAFIGNSVAVV